MQHKIVACAGALVAVLVLRWVNRETRRYRKPSDPFFSGSYSEARAKFRALATAIGAEMEQFALGADASHNVELTIDTAYVRRNPSQLLIHICGVHGVEGFAGSAIQSMLLTELSAEKSSDSSGPSILFVHAANPFGFHFLRRFNERNVDLNRNFLITEDEWAAVRSRLPNQFHYEDVRPLLNPARMLKWYEWYSFLLFSVLKLRRFVPKVRKAVVAGQYHDPNGLNFGGQHLERSNQILCDLFAKYGEKAKTVVCIDVHTGLGESGVDTLLVDDAAACSSFLPDHSFSAPNTDSVSAGYEDTVGCVRIAAVLTSAKVALHITQEFGTVAPLFVLWAMIFEHSAYRFSALWSSPRAWAADQLRDAFYVPTDAWRNQVLRRGNKLFYDCLTRLGKDSA